MQCFVLDEGKPWAPELVDVLRDGLRDREGAEYLRELLRRNPSLRLSRRRGVNGGEGGD